MNELIAWNNFYVIIGSAAGALIGLQFVAMTLVAERPMRNAAEVSTAFATPTIVHFCAVLFLSAILCVPWQSMTQVAVCWGALGACGVAYALIVIRRMRTQAVYKPVFNDWLYYGILPLIGYTVLVIAAVSVSACQFEALLGVGAAVLILLTAGIHNSWDAVTYHLFVGRVKRNQDTAKP